MNDFFELFDRDPAAFWKARYDKQVEVIEDLKESINKQQAYYECRLADAEATVHILRLGNKT